MSISIERLQADLNLTEQKARAVSRLIKGELSPDNFKSVRDWVRQCYSEPRRSEKVMKALNELLSGYGDEGLRIEGAHIDNYHYDIVASYVNQGDTYDATILLDHKRNKYRLTSWGDFVERFYPDSF